MATIRKKILQRGQMDLKLPMPAHRHELKIGDRMLPLFLVRNLRARRYILRLTPAGAARVTIPRGGSIGAALDFVQRHIGWLEQQLQQPRPASTAKVPWNHGTSILWRGDSIALTVIGNEARLNGFALAVQNPGTDLRPEVEHHMRQLATPELTERTLELAAQHCLTVNRVTVRDQRSRWGSCSRRRTISLNWRLIQAPDFVRDYIILHELMHLREMNHSPRYWREVEKVCPNYRDAERWLKANGRLIK